jgi:hypothetical protein
MVQVKNDIGTSSEVEGEMAALALDRHVDRLPVAERAYRIGTLRDCALQ